MTPAIRRGEPGDQAYVASTWLRSMNKGRRRPQDAELRSAIDRVLDHPSSRVLVACDADDNGYIAGWLCYANVTAARVIHYVYVRKQHRGHGIGRALLEYDAQRFKEPRPILYTHSGPSLSWIRGKLPVTYLLLTEVL